MSPKPNSQRCDAWFSIWMQFCLSIASFDFYGERSKRIVCVCNALCKWLITLWIAKEESDEILNSRQEDTVTKNHNKDRLNTFLHGTISFCSKYQIRSRTQLFEWFWIMPNHFLPSIKAGTSIESKFQQEKRKMSIWSMVGVLGTWYANGRWHLNITTIIKWIELIFHCS